MPDQQTPDLDSSTSWGGRTLRRTAGSVIAAVTFALVAPAVANAVGADIANPVAVALRGSVEAISGALGDDDTSPCTPLATVTTPPAATDDTSDAKPRKKAKKAKKCVSASPSASASASAEPKAENHGLIVSTVSKCSPRGKDPLFAATAPLTHHGSFVKAAAHGDTLALPFGSYDLSTLAGAESLCAALEAQRATLPSASAQPRGKDKAKDVRDKARERKATTRDGDAKGKRQNGRTDSAEPAVAEPADEPDND